MIAALALATATHLASLTPVTVLAGDLIGLTPRELAARVGAEPDHADDVVGATRSGGRTLVVLDPSSWFRAFPACRPATASFWTAPTRGVRVDFPRFVFVDGRLARIKTLDADVLAHVDDPVGDLPVDTILSVTCHPSNQRASDTVLGALIYGPVLAPWAAGRSVVIASRRQEGGAVLSHFRLGEAAGDLAALRAAHPDAVQITDDGETHRVVRIRFGTNAIAGDPPTDLRNAYDIYVIIDGGAVTAVRQGYLLHAACRLEGDGTFRCD